MKQFVANVRSTACHGLFGSTSCCKIQSNSGNDLDHAFQFRDTVLPNIVCAPLSTEHKTESIKSYVSARVLWLVSVSVVCLSVSVSHKSVFYRIFFWDERINQVFGTKASFELLGYL